MTNTKQQWLQAFTGGFIATLLFHQGVLALFWLGGLIPTFPWNMTPVSPLGIPQVLSLAFWGGVWGLPVWLIIRRWQGIKFWLSAMIIGAIGPTLVAMLLVFPMKGFDVNATKVVGGLIVNAAWGLGLAVWMQFSLHR
ncbi:hypothetical protein [Alcanivorax borkumensis]|uniref:hypothetical protein n=1 Tax=Alcanivorax borkumensis TaxID=59754 RepID=UPI00356B1C3D